jgi:hypothetical protein
LVGTTAMGLATILGLGAASAAAVQLGPLTKVSDGDRFATCKADNVAKQEQQTGAVNYPNTEIEPWITANPADPKDVLAGWQQDRWSDGGSRGLLAGLSRNGAASFTTVVPGRVSKCEGGPWIRTTDPWLDFSPNGTAYFTHLAIQTGELVTANGPNGVVVTRSTDGGRTWGRPITLIRDTNPQILNDKPSVTADPTKPAFAYATWDRIRDFTIPPGGGEPAPGGLDPATRASVGVDGTELARAWAEFMKRRSESGEKAPTQVLFDIPLYFARTTDGGKTWEKARKIFDPGPNEVANGAQIVVRPDGTLVDFFTHILPNGAPRLELIRWVLSRSANPQPLQGFAPRRRPWPGPTASSTSTSAAPSSASSRPAPRSARSPNGSGGTRPPSTASWAGTASATAAAASAATSP